MRTAITRIAYVTMVGGIVGGIWWLGRLQHDIAQMDRCGLPAPAAQSTALYTQVADR